MSSMESRNCLSLSLIEDRRILGVYDKDHSVYVFHKLAKRCLQLHFNHIMFTPLELTPSVLRHKTDEGP